MEWLYIILGIVFGVPLLLIVTVMIVGRFLPERYEAKLIVDLDRKPQEVWDALQDIDKNAITGKMRKRLEKLADVDGKPSWIEDLGSTKILITTEEAQAPAKLRRHLADQIVPMTADTDVALAETPTGCRVIASSVTVIRSGTWHVPFFRVMMKLTGGGRTHLKSFWTELAKNLGATLRFV